MSEDQKARIPQEHVLHIRKLVHDMSNGLEIIVQTNYLLNMGELSEEARKWLKMMESGVQQTTAISNELREYVVAHCAPERELPPAASGGAPPEGTRIA